MFGKIVKLSELKGSRVSNESELEGRNKSRNNSSFIRFPQTSTKQEKEDLNISFRVRKPYSRTKINSFAQL